MSVNRRARFGFACGLAIFGLACVQAADKRPNILVLWGDDIGYWNISAYNQGMMGYRRRSTGRAA